MSCQLTREVFMQPKSLSGPTSSGSSGTVTEIGTGAGLTGGPIATSGTIALAPIAGVSGNNYTNATINVNGFGQITSVASGVAASGTVTEVDTGVAATTGLTGGPITTTGTLSLASVPGVAGSGYTNPNITVNGFGQITSIASAGFAASSTTWTPSMLIGGVNNSANVSSATGHYVQYGCVVFIQGQIQWTALIGVGTDAITIGGLPVAYTDFGTAGLNGGVYMANVAGISPAASATPCLSAQTATGGSGVLQLQQLSTAGGSNVSVTQTLLATAGHITFSGYYFTA